MLAFTNMLSPWHILLIGIVALLLFGNRLPEVGRSLGRGIAEFKKGLREMQDELDRKDDDKDGSPPPRLRSPEDTEPSVRPEDPPEHQHAEPASHDKGKEDA
jgi:sec-independent protein translocase protein TatA